MNNAPASAVPAVPEPAVTVRGLRDFSDRLSPMLVKELRQGMRSPVFVWGLIAMNIFLAMVVWLTTEDPGERDLHRSFFGGFCVLVCGLLPLRGANALHEELRGNTIDTLVLTKLSGWRITLGKWVAVAAQQLLTTVTVLPYLIVRYFAGGLNVPLELAWLGIFLLLGLLSAAVLTGFSWVKYFLLRAAIMLGVTAASGAFCAAVLDEMYGYRNEYFIDEIQERLGWKFFVIAGVAVAHVMYFALDIGAAQVASISENRSTRRRLVGLGAIAVYLGLGFWSVWSPVTTVYYSEGVLVAMGIFLASVTSLVLMLQSLLEKPVNLAPVLQPFVRRGWAGRLLGRFLYPGWPSGVMFSALLFGIGLSIAGTVIWQAWDPGYSPYTSYSSGYRPFNVAYWNARDWSYLVCGILVIPFTLPVPLVIHQWIFRARMNWHLGTYVLMLALLACVELVLIALSAGTSEAGFVKFGLPIPSMSWAWLAYVGDNEYYRLVGTPGNPENPNILSWERPLIIAITLLVGAFWWITAMVMALRELRETSAAERALTGRFRRNRATAAAASPAADPSETESAPPPEA